MNYFLTIHRTNIVIISIINYRHAINIIQPTCLFKKLFAEFFFLKIEEKEKLIITSVSDILLKEMSYSQYFYNKSCMTSCYYFNLIIEINFFILQ